MRFIYALFFACLLPVLGYSQKKQTGNDSLRDQVNQLSKEFKALKQTNDSLNKELYYFRAKEDYYSTSLASQGTHFEWMITTGLAVLGLFSFGYLEVRFRLMSKSFSSKIKDISNLYSSITEKTDLINYELLRNSGVSHGNLATIVGIFNDSESATHETLYSSQMFLSGIAIIQTLKAYKLAPDDIAEEELIGHLKEYVSNLKSFFEEMRSSPNLKELLLNIENFYAVPGIKIKESIEAHIPIIKDEALKLDLMDLLVKRKGLEEAIDSLNL